MKLKIDILLFLLSVNILLFYVSINFIDRFRYIFILITIFILISFYKSIISFLRRVNILFNKTCENILSFNFNKNFLINLKIFLITIIFASLIGKYDLLLIKTYVVSSQSQLLMQIGQKKENLILSEDNFTKDIKKNKSLDKNLKILLKREGDGIRFLNNNFESEKLLSKKSLTNKYLVPFYIFPNGDLLVSSDWWFDSQGLYKVDKDFNVLWNLDKPIHHYASIKKDKIYVPSFSFIRWKDFKKKELYKKFENFNCNNDVKKVVSGDIFSETLISPGQYEEGQFIRTDEILSVNLYSGEIIKKIDLLSIMSEDDNFLNIIHQSTNSRCKDMLHLNDVVKLDKKVIINYLPPHTLKQNQDLSDNLFLLSFRDINTIAIFDFDNEKFVWSITGMTRSQHSPRLLENGNILVYDNFTYEHNGSTQGISSLKEINIKTKRIVSSYRGNNVLNLATIRRGRLQVKDDIIYVLASDQEKFYEVKCEPKNKSFLNNCNINLIYSFEQKNIFENTIFMSDVYEFLDGKYYLLE